MSNEFKMSKPQNDNYWHNSSLFKKVFGSAKKHKVPFVAGILFAVGCFLLIGYITVLFSTPNYCASCHEMKLAYRTWEVSAHNTNNSGVSAQCIDCHLPSKEYFFRHMTLKTYAGIKDMAHHYLGLEYDRQEARRIVLENMPNQRCLNCHQSLLISPSSPAAWLAHAAALRSEEDTELRCVTCHSHLHEREKMLFSKD